MHDKNYQFNTIVSAKNGLFLKLCNKHA